MKFNVLSNSQILLCHLEEMEANSKLMNGQNIVEFEKLC